MPVTYLKAKPAPPAAPQSIAVEAPKKSKKSPPPRLKQVSAFNMQDRDSWKVRRDLYRSLCRTPGGKVSFEAADLYQDILDIWQGSNRVQNFNKRDGCFYWGRSIAEWAKRYKCTERHFKWLLKVLRDSDLVATCVMKKPCNKLHIRPLVADGAACLSGWPDVQNYAALLECKTQYRQGPAGEKCPNAGGHKVSECLGTESVPAKDSRFKQLDFPDKGLTLVKIDQPKPIPPETNPKTIQGKEKSKPTPGVSEKKSGETLPKQPKEDPLVAMAKMREWLATQNLHATA